MGSLPLAKAGDRPNAGGGKPALENNFLQVTIQPDGSLDLLDKQTGHTFTGQHYFEDCGEAGHAWIHMAPTEDQVLTTLGSQATIECLESSELVTRYRVCHRLTIPAGLDGPTCSEGHAEATGEPTRRSRATVVLLIEREGIGLTLKHKHGKNAWRKKPMPWALQEKLGVVVYGEQSRNAWTCLTTPTTMAP